MAVLFPFRRGEKMIAYVWPVALVVFANTFYHIAAKSTPENLNPFASLTVTYLIGAVVSLILYKCTEKNGSFFEELSHINWAPVVLGFVIVALEAGSIYAYRAGWPLSTAYLVESAFLAVILLLVGLFAYHEGLSWNKAAGMFACFIGIMLLNLK